ncbi:MAG TPA: TlpA disulfide reductase family protein [Syntrophales bacterium]|nr:TlpA disulfide reductase family protein [Syntrophales bacterium]
MRKFLRWVISFILVFNIITFFFVPNFLHGEEVTKTQDNDLALDFILKDLDGRNVRLSDYKGRTVLLYFMATWCPECRSTISQLKEIYSLYNAKGLVLLNINVMESREKALAFSKKNSLPFPTLLDGDGKVYQSYGVVGVPVKALIDRNGRIICWNCRTLDKMLEKQFELKTTQ